MRLDLHRPSWAQRPPAFDTVGISSILDGAWAEAATRFAVDRSAKRQAGRRPPIGAQPYLNRVLEERFTDQGWDAHGGRFLRDGVWLRITFRHQMSLGSDLLDAFKVLAKRDAEVAIVAAATFEFLRVISPNDASALTSYEKVASEVRDLDGAVSLPVLVGELRPRSTLPPATAAVVFGPRPREG